MCTRAHIERREVCERTLVCVDRNTQTHRHMRARVLTRSQREREGGRGGGGGDDSTFSLSQTVVQH